MLKGENEQAKAIFEAVLSTGEIEDADIEEGEDTLEPLLNAVAFYLEGKIIPDAGFGKDPDFATFPNRDGDPLSIAKANLGDFSPFARRCWKGIRSRN